MGGRHPAGLVEALRAGSSSRDLLGLDSGGRRLLGLAVAGRGPEGLAAVSRRLIDPAVARRLAGLAGVSSGKRVRNLKAFQVLESVYLKTSNPALSQHILLAIKSIWTWDPMNFFLLEWSLQPMSQFVSLLPLKPPPVQTQFFQMIESIILDLSYIPHDILKKVQDLIKENSDPLGTSAALRCLWNISQKDMLFTDIFRDSGLLGMLLALLRKEAKILRRKGGAQVPGCPGHTPERELISRMLKMVAVLLVGSVRNTVVLRDYGMVPYIKIFLDDQLYRSDTLTVLEQLSVVNPEEYMSIIVGALCSSTQGELDFRLDLLKVRRCHGQKV
uniref:Uncharacterized protein n=1 Tax=Sphaerodactylus townsendi TaxID=933632 RepID=A0ACB8F787_9SAUR